jgi:hypothetical protein
MNLRSCILVVIVIITASQANLVRRVKSQDSEFFWSSGPWTVQAVPDVFYGKGEGCKLSLERGERSVTFSAFYIGGPVTLKGPELKNLPLVGTLYFIDPLSGQFWSSFGRDDSTANDDQIIMRLPSATMMLALEWYAEHSVKLLIVSDAARTFEMPIDVTGLKPAADAFRLCVNVKQLGF